MSESKLMKPLFRGYRFNAKGTKMRAVFCHEVSNGKEAYSLWRSAGKPDVTYPHAENDAYWLHIELNGYLVPLGQSEYDLIHSSGKKPAYQKLYGSLKAREEQMNQARTGSGPTLHELFSKEMDEIERMGAKPECQADYISTWLGEKVKQYQKAKATGGETAPDYIGALVLQELDQCVSLFAVYRDHYERRRQEWIAAAQKERDERGMEVNRQLENAVADAEKKLIDGGMIDNVKIEVYQSGRGSRWTNLIRCLLEKYNIAVPIRTLGWINNSLTRVTIMEANKIRVSYLQASGSRSKGSEKVFNCLYQLVDAIKQQQSSDTGTATEV